MAEPTITDQPDLPPIQDLPAAEYREVRGGKSVADVVAARPEPSVDPAASPASADGTPDRDKAGRFVKQPEIEVKAGEPITLPAGPSKTGNPRHNPQARIDELTKEKGDAVRRAEVAEADRERYRLEVDAFKRGEGPKPEPVIPKAEPATVEEFPEYDAWTALPGNEAKSYERYIRDAAAFDREQERKAHQQADFEKTARAEFDQQLKPFKDRETAFKATTADYDDVIQRSPVATMPLPPWVIEEIRTSEQGPALRYYLAQHPDETAWLAAQPKAAAVAFLKSLVTSVPVASAVTTGTAPKTKADPPFETVGASAAASTHSVETVAASGSAADYRRLRESGVRR